MTAVSKLARLKPPEATDADYARLVELLVRDKPTKNEITELAGLLDLCTFRDLDSLPRDKKAELLLVVLTEAARQKGIVDGLAENEGDLAKIEAENVQIQAEYQALLKRFDDNHLRRAQQFSRSCQLADAQGMLGSIHARWARLFGQPDGPPATGEGLPAIVTNLAKKLGIKLTYLERKKEQ